MTDIENLENTDFYQQVKTYLDKLGVECELQFSSLLNEMLLVTSSQVSFKFNFIFDGSGLKNQQQSLIAHQHNVQLIHLWEDLWFTKRNIVQSRIRSLFNKLDRIHGRETEIREISNKELLLFLNEHHLSIPIKGKYRYGLIYKDTLVSVLSLNAPKKFRSDDGELLSYEILRFCHKNGYTVVGGLSKLLKHFILNHSPAHMMTYIDLEWGNGEGFVKHGFKKVDTLKPLKFILDIKSKVRYHSSFQAKEILESHSNSPTQPVSVYNSGSLKLIRWLNG